LLENVDGRTRDARRFRDIVSDLTVELGGDLSPSESHLVRLAASTLLRGEQLQALVANGAPVDDAELVRIVNSGARIIRELRVAKAKRAPPPTAALADLIATIKPTPEPDDEDDEL
jgi:hypothetical protein